MTGIIPFIIGVPAVILYVRKTTDKKIRWIGGCLILLASFLFYLYCSGISGIGLSAQIVKLFEKVGFYQ